MWENTMTQEGFKRKLTAILSADAEGYSRLMGDNEESTIRTLTGYLETMTKSIQQHRGRVVDAPGDNLLAEFASVVDAVSWYFYFRSTPSEEQAASKLKTAFSISERPAIAVLPFTNLSEDPQQEYFSDGITIDIITDLSKFRHLFVIAGNTVFTYKGKSVKITELGKELSVQYVLECLKRRSN